MKRLALILLLCACGSSKDDAILHEAAVLHDEALEIAHDTALRISQLKKMEAQFSEGRRDSLQAIATGLGEWYDLVVEVPGHDHDHHDHGHGDDHGHDHGHDHDHDHGSAPNYLEGLSAQEILEVQAELKREVEQLQGRLRVFESAM